MCTVYTVGTVKPVEAGRRCVRTHVSVDGGMTTTSAPRSTTPTTRAPWPPHLRRPAGARRWSAALRGRRRRGQGDEFRGDVAPATSSPSRDGCVLPLDGLPQPRAAAPGGRCADGSRASSCAARPSRTCWRRTWVISSGERQAAPGRAPKVAVLGCGSVGSAGGAAARRAVRRPRSTGRRPGRAGRRSPYAVSTLAATSTCRPTYHGTRRAWSRATTSTWSSR